MKLPPKVFTDNLMRGGTPALPPEPRKGPKVKDRIKVIRINPETRAIAELVIEMSTTPGDGHGQIAKMLRGNRLGTQLLNIGVPTVLFGNVPLVAAGVFDVDRQSKRWGLKYEAVESPLTSGLGMIMAVGPGGGMISMPYPVNAEWVREHIVWADGVADDDYGKCQFCEEPATHGIIIDREMRMVCPHHDEMAADGLLPSCSFCDKVAITIVDDVSGGMGACAEHAAEWEKNPGFLTDEERAVLKADDE